MLLVSIVTMADVPDNIKTKIQNKEQLTDAPTLYITIPSVSDISTMSKWVDGDKNKGEFGYWDAEIQVVDASNSIEVFTDSVKIKVRGNSTASADKKPYRLKFAKKHKHDLMGAGYTKRNWVLLANALDNSLIRNAVTYHIGKYVGMDFNPGYKFVDVVLNGDYRGCYQVTDQVEIGSHRIDMPDEDNDWYVEFQGRGDMLDKPLCFAKNGLQMNIKSPEPADDTNKQQVDSVIKLVKDWFIKTWQPKVQYSSSDKFSLEKGWRSVNDEESLAKFYLVTNLTGDYDGFMTVKAYRDHNGGKLIFGPVWDKDLAFGNYSHEESLIEKNGNASSLNSFITDVLLKDPNFTQKLSDMMDKLVDDGLYTKLCSDIDSMAQVISGTETLNFQKWDITANTNGNIGLNAGVTYPTYPQYIQQLKDWLKARITFVQDKMHSINAAAGATTDYKYDVTMNVGGNDFYNNTGKLLKATLSGRELSANQWNAISLPWSLTDKQLKEAFGDEYKLREFSGVSEDGKTMNFTTPAETKLKAGVPYLIKPSAVANPIVFNKVMIEASNVGQWTDGKQYDGDAVTFGNYSFTGAILMKPWGLTANDLQVNPDGTFTALNSGTINGSQAYITKLNGAADPVLNIEETTVNPDVRAQKNASVPTIYIDTDAAIGDTWGNSAIEIFDNGNLIGGNATLTSAENALGVQYQGSDKEGEKNSYRLKFAKKRALIGSTAYKQWVLLSENDDPSLVRDALTSELGSKLGFAFTPRAQFVDLYVNNTYMGTYTLTDRVKVEKGRVFVADKDADWLLELDSKDEIEATDLYVPGDDLHPYVNIKNPDPDDLTAEQQESQKESVATWMTSFWNGIADNVDRTSFVNWYIASEILGDYKQFEKIYAYKSADAAGKLFFGPLWDNEKAYGNRPKHVTDMTDLNTDGSYKGLLATSADNGAWKSILQKLWQEEWFKTAVTARWDAVKGSLLTDLQAKLTALQASVDETQADNFAPTADGGAGWTREVDEATAIKAISDYLNERFAYLDKKFADMKNGVAIDYVFEPSKNLADSKLEDYVGKNVNITIADRTLYNGVWNTFIIPFNASEAQMKAALGCDYELREHSAVNGDVMTFTAPSTKDIKHGVPYIIRPAAKTANNQLVFNNVTISFKATGKDHIVSFDNNAHQFVGNINHVVLTTDGTNLFLGPDNTLFRANADNHEQDGIRCYFVIPAGSNAKVNISGDGETTSIRQINGAEIREDSPRYNIAGQRVGKDYKGLVIVNGKKFIQK